MAVRTIEVNDSLSELVQGAIDEVKYWFDYEIKNSKNIKKADFENVDSLIDALNYNGNLHDIVDSSVPVYTHELDTLFYLHKNKLIDAFENSGIGERSEYDNNENVPLGFEGVAIFCYIEEQVTMYLYNGFQEWFSTKYWEILE